MFSLENNPWMSSFAGADLLKRKYPAQVRIHPNTSGRSLVLIDSDNISNPPVLEATTISSFQRMIEVPFHSMNLDFATIFDYYAARHFSPVYQKEIESLAAHAGEKLQGNFDLFVGIPTRKEAHTGRAVEAIQDNCRQSGLRPAIFVYHNYDYHPGGGILAG